jgi:oligosaccharide repeat unit polymerase
MSLILIAVVTLLGILAGKYIFKKWINHLSLYCLIMGGLIFLYELKLLPYNDISTLTWFLIISSFLAFLFGILTVISARNLKQNNNSVQLSIVNPTILHDNGKLIKYALIFFSAVGIFAGIQNWMVLIDMFGSIPAVLINANIVYRLNVNREVKGVIPYIAAFTYVAVFLAGLYTAYNGKFSWHTFLPFVGIIIKELATLGRAGILLAAMQFLFSFFLFRNFLKKDTLQRYKFSIKNAVISSLALIFILVLTSSLVKFSRGVGEKYPGASPVLSQFSGNMLINPSLYLYLSSDVGVLNQYLLSEGEDTKFGENTFLLFHQFLAKLGVQERPSDFQKGYYVPMWTNTGTYIRELHADFGISGLLIVSFLLGVVITWLWFNFYEKGNISAYTILVHLYLIIGFSFLVMVTRLYYWVFSLIISLVVIAIIEKINQHKTPRAINTNNVPLNE